MRLFYERELQKNNKGQLQSHHKLFSLISISLLVFVYLSFAFYIYRSHQYPQWDEHQYLSLAVNLYDQFRHPLSVSWGSILAASGYRQPVFSIVIALLLLIFGTAYTYKMALLLNGLFYLAAIIGTYVIARTYFTQKKSLLVAIVFASLGNVLFYSHFTYTETAVSTFCIWSVVFLLKTNSFVKTKETLVAAVFLALASLTRWVGPVFVLGPALAVFIMSVGQAVREKKVRKNIIVNIVLFLIIGVVVPIFAYYIPNAHIFFDVYVKNNQTYGAEWVAQYRSPDMANTLSTRSVMYYFNIMSQNTVWIFIPFAVGVLIALWKWKRYGVPLLGVAVPYLFFTGMAVWKEDRFIVPLYPYMAFLAVLPLAGIQHSAVRRFFTVCFVVVAVCSYFGAFWAIGPMGKQGLKDIVLPEFIHHPRRIYLTPIVWPPNKEFVNADVMVSTIRNDWKGPGKPDVVKLFAFEPLDNAFLSILTYEQRDIMVMDTEVPKDAVLPKKLELHQADYVLDKVPGGVNATVIESLGYDRFRDVFVPIDGSTIEIFKKREKI